MKLDSLVIDWDSSLHNNKSESGLVAIGVKEAYEYNGSKRTERVIGYNIEVVDTFNRFEKTVIRVPNKPFDIKDDDNYLNVYFSGLRGKAYMEYSTNTVKFSVCADNVEILN
jgi:hypothetical protein